MQAYIRLILIAVVVPSRTSVPEVPEYRPSGQLPSIALKSSVPGVSVIVLLALILAVPLITAGAYVPRQTPVFIENLKPLIESLTLAMFGRVPVKPW